LRRSSSSQATIFAVWFVSMGGCSCSKFARTFGVVE
jgi:hypothetical protein